MAGEGLLEARELDDDEAVEFIGALEDLELAAARQDLAAERLQDARHQLGVLLVLIGVVDLRARDPISDISSSMPTVSMLGIVAARFAIVSCEQFGPYRTVFD